METAQARGQFTSLLTNEQLAIVERLRLNPTRRFTNRARGEHLHGKGGSSTDFADYRNYVAGDDVRFVDWNIFSRLHRPYLKQFRQEEEMHLVVLVDASSSMAFEGKIDLAKQLASAFAIMGLFATERVSAYVFNQIEGRLEFTGPDVGRGNMRKVFNFLERIEAGGDAPLENGVDMLLKRHSGRGVIAVLSDFLTFGDLRRSFNALLSRGMEIFGVQILGPTEIDPQVSADLRLVDCESQATLDISAAGDLASLYQEYRHAYARHLEVLCRQRNGRFMSVSAADSFDDVVFDQMRRKGWVV